MAKQARIIASLVCCIFFTLSIVGVKGIRTPNDELRHDQVDEQLNNERQRRDLTDQQMEQTTTSVMPIIYEPEDVDDSNKPNGYEQNFRQRSLVKRAPSLGFTGMRGKKDYDTMLNELNSNNDNDNNWLNNIEPLDHDYTIGDDEEFNDGNSLRYKKAPTAFYGVRGKKYTNAGGSSDLMRMQQIIRQLEEDRLREHLLQDFIDRLATNTMNYNEIVAKRAPTGFTGMRGKRPAINDFVNDGEEIEQDIIKRAPNNAFVGVRGKKDVSHQNYKRSATANFWSNFMGKALETRGKKQQRFIDLSNKFVAVRGKKSQADAISDVDFDVDVSDDVNEPRLAVVNGRTRYFINSDNNNKRTPSGFLGMRGKRPTATNLAQQLSQ